MARFRLVAPVDRIDVPSLLQFPRTMLPLKSSDASRSIGIPFAAATLAPEAGRVTLRDATDGGGTIGAGAGSGVVGVKRATASGSVDAGSGVLGSGAAGSLFAGGV